VSAEKPVTSLSATLSLRPTRIGFLVDPSDMSAVRHVMQICTCLWGGFYNPIIPVCTSIPGAWKSPAVRDPTGTELANGYIDFFEPDVYVEATPGLSTHLNVGGRELEHGYPRVLPITALLEASSEEKDYPPVGLSMYLLYRALYEREFKFVARHDHRVGLFEGAAPEDEPFLDAVCGGFPASGMLQPHARAYRDAFAPQVLEANAKNWTKTWQDRYRFPLYFTRHELERAPGRGLGEPTLFVADPMSPLDLIDLWNIRIFRRNVVPINLRWLSDLTTFMRELIERNHRPLPGNTHGVMMHTTVEFGRSIGEGRARELIETNFKDLPTRSAGYKLWYDHIWTPNRSDYSWPQRRAIVTAKSVNVDLTLSEDGRERSVRFSTLAPEFAPTYGNGPSAWVNVLRFQRYVTGTKLALSLPTDFDHTQAWHLRLGGAMISSREGLVLPERFKGHGEYLRILTGREAMTEWLKQRGVAAEVSKSGRVAEQVLDSLDGFWGAKLLADRETLELLDSMAKSVRKYGDGTVQEFQDRTAAATRWEGVIARRRQDLWSSNITLDRFVQANVLKLGLAIECSHCINVNWYAIDDLQETLICERCRRSYPFPQGTIRFTNSPWKFRVIGPYSVPDYADGAYATVLTLRVFAETLGSGHASLTYSPGLDLTRDSGGSIEVDFSFWYSRDSFADDQEETVTVFGEAKSFGEKSFGPKELEKMHQIAELFPGSFLVFAALKEELHQDEKTAIAALAQWGREPLDDGRPRAPVIVLTGTELFSSWHIENTWKKLPGLRKQIAETGHIHLDNLWTLADVTQQVYLDLPSRSEELRRQWEAEAKARSAGQKGAEEKAPQLVDTGQAEVWGSPAQGGPTT